MQSFISPEQNIEVVSYGELIRQAYEEHGAWDKPGAKIVRIGLGDFDEVMGGMRAAEVAVVAGRTNQGKSTILQDLADKAEENGASVLYLSAEDPASLTGARLQTKHTGMTVMGLRKLGPKKRKHERFLHAVQQKRNIDFIVRRRASIEVVLAAFEKAKNNRYDILFIDHLHALSVHGLDKDVRLSYQAAVSYIHQWACEYNISVVYGSQIGRPRKDGRTNQIIHEPDISEMAESAQIERSADYIFLVWRNGSEGHVKLAKNRPCGDYLPVWRTSKDDRGVLQYEYTGAMCSP